MLERKEIKILLISENPQSQQLIEAWLADRHTFTYRVSWLNDYQYALNEILSDEYDIGLIDYAIANKKGLTLLCEANNQQCNIPLILLTDKDDTEIDLIAMVAGAADYLVKDSLNSQLLERSIRYALERKQTEKRLHLINEQNRRLAEYDVLTGLANRNLFNKTLSTILSRLVRHQDAQVALLFLDLDNFKVINDSLGHDAGDILLCEVARRLYEGLRSTDKVFRLGGDEFIIILEGNYDATKIARAAEKIIDLLSPAIELKGNQIFVNVSIGVATTFGCGYNLEQLFKSADTAMYSAKERGGNTYEFFTPELNQQVVQRIAVENNLRHALERQEFFLHYQPRVNLATGRIVSVEALLRWQNSELGLVPPLDFIPIAEDTGLICGIGEWVIQHACDQLKNWHAQGLALPRVSVNLSMRQLAQDNLVPSFAGIIQKAQVDAHHLELEVTESVIMHHPETNIAILNDLHRLGLSISVDDFGTGYSSLAYLKLLPLDALKVDKVFVHDITLDANDAVLVKAIIALAKSLGLSVVAEGVESQEQLDFLRRHNCDEIQGYFFSRPVDADTIATMLMQDKRLQ